jgi:hypothetical protein
MDFGTVVRNNEIKKHIIDFANEVMDEFNKSEFAVFHKCKIEYDLFSITKKHD